jgi:PilZ domain
MTDTANEDAPVREQRLGRFVGITIERAGKPPEKAIACNVSSSGLGGKTSLMLQPGERITLHLPNNESVSATVCWCAKGRFGVRLDQTIVPETIRPGEGGKIGPGAPSPPPAANFELFRHVGTPHRPGFRVR